MPLWQKMKLPLDMAAIRTRATTSDLVSKAYTTTLKVVLAYETGLACGYPLHPTQITETQSEFVIKMSTQQLKV